MNFDRVGKIDTSLAAAELDRHPLWQQFTVRQNFPGSAHIATQCIPLRGAATFLKSYEPRAKRWRTPASHFLPHTTALVNRVLAGLPVTSVGNVLAVSLRPGGEVLPHIDEGAYPDHFERFHIAVTSPQGNWFKVDGEVFSPEQGDIFFFNHRVTHSVGNPSEDARIHIIVDVTLKESLW